MPLHTAPLSRRSFFAQSAAAAAGLLVYRQGWSAEAGANPNRIALLSDTHIPEGPDVLARDTNMTSNLKQVVREILTLTDKPSAVMINGDCAYLKGLPADYANLADCVAPLSQAGFPLHMTMGNHDDRGPFYEALKNQKPDRPLLQAKHVTVVEGPRANWFLLDSLDQVNSTPGELGAEQREWLSKGLAVRTEKPAIVMAHHTPQFEPPAEGKSWGGLKDTTALMELLDGFKHVKAFIFGHSHHWATIQRGSIHLINLPPVAYVFTAGKPNGWVLADVQENGLSLELRAIDRAHKQHGEKLTLEWM